MYGPDKSGLHVDWVGHGHERLHGTCRLPTAATMQSNTTYVRRSQDGLCPLIARDPCPDAPAHVPPRRPSTQSSSLHRATPAKAGTTGWVDFPRGIRPQAQSRRDTRGACGFQGNLRDTLSMRSIVFLTRTAAAAIARLGGGGPGDMCTCVCLASGDWREGDLWHCLETDGEC